MTSTLTATRVSHYDLAFDADHATVVGTEDRDFMVGSFMELDEILTREAMEEKVSHEAWTDNK